MYELQFRWQYVPSGIRILQGFGDLTCIPVPKHIEGTLVTEIGPYCFSASQSRTQEHTESSPERDGDHFVSFTLDRSYSLLEERVLTNNSLPPLNGRYLEEIILPDCLEVLHNAAFYNCRKLHTLGLSQKITAIGSDVFTNCSSLTRLLYQGSDKEAQSLSLILGRLEMNLEVLFPGPSGILSGIFFPEYYEWLDEVTPAHLFSRSIHGEGFRMRKCFKDHRLDYGKYDACFENATKTESARTLCHTALLRLLWPESLSPEAKGLYKEALKSHFETGLKLILSQRKDGGRYKADPLTMLGLLLDTAASLDASSLALELCITSDWSEGAAFIMERRQQGNFAKKTYSFDDLDDF